MTTRRPTPQLGPAGLISLQDAPTSGWTRSALRHAVATKRCTRERRGVYAFDEAVAELNAMESRYDARDAALVRTAMAAVRTCPRAVLSHSSSAAACAIPLLGRVEHACLTVPAGTALRELDGVHLHRAGLPRNQVINCGAYAMTVPARTALDLAREFGIDAGVVAIDAVLHHKLADETQFEAILRSCTRWPGKRRARAAFELSDGLSESPLESLSRLKLLRTGFPDPKLQTWIYNQDGMFIARTDFGWPELGVVGEADGLDKYQAGWGAVLDERDRERRLLDLGLEVVRWGWADLASFDRVIAELRAAVARRQRSSRPRLWVVGAE